MVITFSATEAIFLLRPRSRDMGTPRALLGAQKVVKNCFSQKLFFFTGSVKLVFYLIGTVDFYLKLMIIEPI